VSRPPASSSVWQARVALADRLHDIRLESGLTAREVARRCGWHESKCSRIERARTAPSQADVVAWCRACGAKDQIADLTAFLQTIDSMYVEWRRLHRSGLRRQQESRLPLYERTRRFQSYSSWLVPGLLQTQTYTTAVLGSIMRRQTLPDDVDASVAARMQRQRVLREGDHRFAFLIEQSVLHNAVCDVNGMTDQLDHLITCMTLPSVSLGIVPAQLERVRWPVEGFWIFDGRQVNVELVSSYLTITQPAEVTEYVRTFQDLSHMAAFGDDALSLLTDAANTLR
jgi:transcriptional regulator with XRE-family HTH domain